MGRIVIATDTDADTPSNSDVIRHTQALRAQLNLRDHYVEIVQINQLANRDGPLLGFDACVFVLGDTPNFDAVGTAMKWLTAFATAYVPDGLVLPIFIASAVTITFEYSDGPHEVAEWVEKILKTWPQQQVVRQEKIDANLSKFIEPTIDRLEKRETETRDRAVLAYQGGLGALFVAFVVVATLIFLPSPWTKPQPSLPMFITTSIAWSLKGLILVAILVAMSKYFFNYGKAWMNESLRASDRRHAIEFGKFYLQVYGAEAKPEEIRAVFETWNIDTTSTFAALDANDHDPRLFDKAMELVGKSTELVKAAVGEKKDTKREEK